MASTTNQGHIKSQPADVLIPLIRAAATIGFAVAPCSLGFVIIAVSEQLVRSIMVGDDPEMLVSELQNQFPNHAIEVADKDQGLVAQIVDLINRAPGGWTTWMAAARWPAGVRTGACIPDPLR
jgi:hypothetical protein